MKIVMMALEALKPYAKNPRLNEAAIAAVAESIRRFGFRQPIVVDRQHVIVCGHSRYLAAQELKLKRVPVHVADDLTPAQARAYRIADNKTSELAEWDMDLLRGEVADLGAEGIDWSLLGFDSGDLDAMNPGSGLVDEDQVPEPADAAITQPGDVWILGAHRLMCGDSSSAADVDRLLEGEPIHLVNTDPPYNVKVEPRSNNAIAAGLSSFAGYGNTDPGRDAARRPEKTKATERKMRPKDRPLENDFVSDEAFDALLAAWFGNIARVLLPGRGFYIWGGYANVGNYPPVLKACELYFSQAIIWVKEHPVLTRKDFMGNHEWCFYGWREGGGHKYFGPVNISDVWRVCRHKLGHYSMLDGLRLEALDGARIDLLPPQADRKITSVKIGESVEVHGSDMVTDVWSIKKVNPTAMVHLTEKPVELAARAMRYSSQRGEHVLDLFGGSGSTLIAAEKLERRAFLMELDALYADVIVSRWEAFTGKKAQRQRPGGADGGQRDAAVARATGGAAAGGRSAGRRGRDRARHGTGSAAP